MSSFYLAWNQLLQSARSSLFACGVSGHLGYSAGQSSVCTFCGDSCLSQYWICRVIFYLSVVSTLAVCDMISMVRMQPAAGQLQVAATHESTCTGFGQDTDVLHLKKWIFGVSWCCSQHLSAHWSLKRVEVTFRWCGYDKTGSYMLLFLTSGSLLQIKLSWFIENNPDVIFNHKLMSYYFHRWLSSSFWDPCWAQTLFSVLSPVTDLTR